MRECEECDCDCECACFCSDDGGCDCTRRTGGGLAGLPAADDDEEEEEEEADADAEAGAEESTRAGELRLAATECESMCEVAAKLRTLSDAGLGTLASADVAEEDSAAADAAAADALYNELDR